MVGGPAALEPQVLPDPAGFAGLPGEPDVAGTAGSSMSRKAASSRLGPSPFPVPSTSARCCPRARPGLADRRSPRPPLSPGGQGGRGCLENAAQSRQPGQVGQQHLPLGSGRWRRASQRPQSRRRRRRAGLGWPTGRPRRRGGGRSRGSSRRQRCPSPERCSSAWAGSSRDRDSPAYRRTAAGAGGSEAPAGGKTTSSRSSPVPLLRNRRRSSPPSTTRSMCG